jgi:sugar phosphate isomerase/epimerase
MKTFDTLSRRSFLSALAVAPLGAAALASAETKQIPIGLELYSVRNILAKDLMGTVSGVAKMGYQCVEFFSPYYSWTTAKATEVRKELDTLGVRCYSTHNGTGSFMPTGINKAIELNKILGARYIVMAYPGEPKTVDDWKKVADQLNQANDTMKAQGLNAGYHNHDAEWRKLPDGQLPLRIIADNTDKSIMLQLDVGTCVAMGGDPAAWIESNPGRIRALHLKEWSPTDQYKVLFGEGVAPWKKIFAAAESVGGAEFYLIEQEGSRYSEMETAQRCLEAYKKLRAA